MTKLTNLSENEIENLHNQKIITKQDKKRFCSNNKIVFVSECYK